MNWIQWIFDSGDFLTRNHCSNVGGWNRGLVQVYQLANIIIAIAYFSIPLTLFGLWLRLRKFKSILQRHIIVVLMFSVFILSCGLGHLMNVISFYYAPYRFFTLIDSVTAISSILTAVMLPSIIYDTLNTILGSGDTNESGKK